MTKDQFALRLKNACAAVEAAEQELTEIDSLFGDADHGLTMNKIAGAISDAVDQSEGGIQSMLDDAAMAVMTLNGGGMPMEQYEASRSCFHIKHKADRSDVYPPR